MKRIIAFFLISIFVCIGIGCRKESDTQAEIPSMEITSEYKDIKTTTNSYAPTEEKIQRCAVEGCDEIACDFGDDHGKVYCSSHYYCFSQNGYVEEMYEDSFVQSCSTESDTELFSRIMPFVGMHEKYVNTTILGDDYKFDVVTFDKSCDTTNRYVWYRNDGRKVINLCVSNKTHRIESIALYYDNKVYPYYAVGEHPTYDSFIKCRDAVYSEQTTQKKDDNHNDPYDVYDYDDPDGFAEDMWEEFDNIYEDGYNEAFLILQMHRFYFYELI